MSTDSNGTDRRQPDIPADLAALSSLCTAAPGSFTNNVALAQQALDRHATGRAPKVSVAACVARALTDEHGITFDVPQFTTTATVDDLVASLCLRGVDGEAVAWSVVGFEAQRHINLVWLEANRHASRHESHTAEDLAGWGYLGLRQAMRGFDKRRGFMFSTYACHRISGSIRDGLRSELPVPKRLLTLQRQVAAARDALQIELDRDVSLAEIADYLDEDPIYLERILPRLDTAASLDEFEAQQQDTGRSVLPQLTDDTDPADRAVEELLKADIDAAFQALDAQTRQVVSYLLWDGESLAEVKRRTGLSDRDVRRHLADGQEALAVSLSRWRSS